ncbi:MAG: YtxH domain-containing protein [Gemmatimonadota bacterium]
MVVEQAGGACSVIEGFRKPAALPRIENAFSREWKMAEQSDGPYIVIERSGFPLGAFLGGIAIGAIVGLLYAPKSGRETQQDIRDGLRRLRDDAEEKFAELREEAGEKYGQVREDVAERLESARSELRQRKHRAEEAVRAGRDAARKAREDLEKRVAESKEEYRERLAVSVGEGAESAETEEEA